MKKLLATIVLGLLYFSPYSYFAQRAKDGDYTNLLSNNVVNSYTYLTANATAGGTSITVNNNSLLGGVFGSALATGDLIMIIQMQGVDMDVNTTPVVDWGGSYTVPNSYFVVWDSNPWEWGQILDYRNAGKYELVEVQSVTGVNTINLNCALQNSYTSSRHVQVIRVPRFNNLTINSSTSIVPATWDGNVGGVVSIEVNGNLVINSNAKISASGKGFRGAVADNNGQIGTSTQHGNGPGNGSTQLGSTSSSEGGRKGEGLGGFTPEYDAIFSRYGRGAPANGGGGGGFQNAGGGGGSNIGSGTYTGRGVPTTTYPNSVWNLEMAGLGGSITPGGGRGGYSLSSSDQNATTLGPNRTAWSADARKENGGLGGHPLAYDATRLFMGGGGGAGDQDSGQGGGGGQGGGIVYLTCYGTVSGSGSIEADGAVGQNTNPLNQSPSIGQKRGNDGAGGGGGGGYVYIKNNGAIPSTISIFARGGNGGNHNLSLGTFASVECSGPGGGGSGGAVAFSSGTPTVNVNAGTSGTTNSAHLSEFIVNGATNGSTGTSGLAAPYFNLVPNNATICSGSTANLSVTVNGTAPGTIYWYTQQFGGAALASGTSFTTPVLSVNTTYYVGACPGSFRIPVTVTVNPRPTISGTAVLTNPGCSTPGSITGLSASGGTPSYTYTWNGNASAGPDLTGAPAGSYTLTVTDVNLCTATSGPYSLVGVSGPSINTTNMVITSQNCNGTMGSITGITASGTPTLTYSWSNSGGNSVDATNLVAGNYTLTVTDGNSCISTTGPHTVGYVAGPSISTTGISIQNATCGNNNGSITGITASGTGLSYTWNGTASASTDLLAQGAGNYTLVVTDGNGCTANSGPFTINAIAGPTINSASIAISPENCNQANGAISGLVINGGTPAYAISWTNTAQTTLDLNSLVAGTYSLTVTDQNSCVATAGPFIVSSSGGPVINETNANVTHVQCSGALGSITGITASGTPTLIYSWSNSGGSNANATNLSAGTYVLTVTDGSGCSSVSSSYTVNAPVPMSLDLTNMTVTPTSCTSNTGAVSGIVVNGGINPVYSWSNSANTLDIANLAAGTYTLSVTDDQGCTAGTNVTITTVNAPVIDLNNLTVTEEHCGQSDASINGITVSGGSPAYSIVWNSNPALNTLNLSGLSAGNYALLVADQAGCTATASVVVNSAVAPTVNATSIVVEQLSCQSQGAISGLVVNGTGPFTYSWTGTSQTSLDITNLNAGSYTLTATDAFNCSVNYGPIVLIQTPGPVASFNYSPLSPSVGESVLFDENSLGIGITNPVFTIEGNAYPYAQLLYTFNAAGTYNVMLTVQDAFGCKDSIVKTIIVYNTVEIPNVITSNNDNVNDLFEIKGLKPQSTLTILNRWGEVVYHSDNYQNNWDGRDVKGDKLIEGVYTYLLITPDDKKMHGFVHLIR